MYIPIPPKHLWCWYQPHCQQSTSLCLCGHLQLPCTQEFSDGENGTTTIHYKNTALSQLIFFIAQTNCIKLIYGCKNGVGRAVPRKVVQIWKSTSVATIVSYSINIFTYISSIDIKIFHYFHMERSIIKHSWKLAKVTAILKAGNQRLLSTAYIRQVNVTEWFMYA